jgi:23S rRNA pseudouridine2605 synthase
LRITVREGRNRQVRKMCDAIGHPVRRLVRTRVGPVSDRRLSPGAWRPLERREVRALYETAGGKSASPSTAAFDEGAPL